MMLEYGAFVYFKMNIKYFHTLVTILIPIIDHKTSCTSSSILHDPSEPYGGTPVSHNTLVKY